MTASDQSIHAVFAEGMEAREDDQPVTSCPYLPGTDEHAHWVDGWHEPDGLDEDEAPSDPLPGLEGI